MSPWSRRSLLLGISLALFGVTKASAQEALVGTWSGTLEVGGGLRLVFHVEQGEEGLTATMDSPDQGANGIPVFDLTVTVTDRELVFFFGPGFWERRFALDDISRVEVVRNSPLYGWGIRYTHHGWLYNVSGLDAVEVTVQGQEQLRIGTDEPEALKRAVEAARATGSPDAAPAPNAR